MLCEEKLTERLSVQSQNICFLLILFPPSSHFATPLNIFPCGWLHFLSKPIVHFWKDRHHSLYSLLPIISQQKLLYNYTCCITDIEDTFIKSENASDPTKDGVIFHEMLNTFHMKLWYFLNHVGFVWEKKYALSPCIVMGLADSLN